MGSLSPHIHGFAFPTIVSYSSDPRLSLSSRLVSSRSQCISYLVLRLTHTHSLPLSDHHTPSHLLSPSPLDSPCARTGRTHAPFTDRCRHHQADVYHLHQPPAIGCHIYVSMHHAEYYRVSQSFSLPAFCRILLSAEKECKRPCCTHDNSLLRIV